MPFEPHLAAIRFGTGLSPSEPPPDSAAAMLARLAGPDEAAQAFPIRGFHDAEPHVAEFAAVARAARDGAPAERAAAEAERERLHALAREARAGSFRATLARLVASPDPLRERLALFWASHFTVEGKSNARRHLVGAFAADAVRPYVAGRFADMLRTAVTHPMMLFYLDQGRSVGPGSRAARNGRGLNENLARELLELHTLGVGGPYGQADVRELAELLTGLGLDQDGGTTFRPNWAEPGAETVLGATYAEGPSLEPILAALDDLAAHPATARHLARKLAVHFVADEPPGALVDHVADAFLATGGDLLATTEALLEHPDAWAAEKRKVKPPVEFLASSLRALGVSPGVIMSQDLRGTRRFFLNPLAVMGQEWDSPGGPDGWPEAAGAWITPQFVAGRIDWAMNRPEELIDPLPDPRDLVITALGPAALPEVAFAARAAERASEGVGVVLASADFQRR